MILTGYGSTGTVHIRDMPEPTLGEDELLVDVHAAGINPLDVKIRDGKLRLVRRFPLPAIMGNELSGVVAAVGRAVRGFEVGDAIFARVDKRHLGAFAERACVHQSHAAHKPSRLSMVEAAGVPLAALTAWQALDLLGVGAGSRVLVHAGAGGVGSFAVQFAKLRGAWVASTASGRNVALVRDLGADQVIDYTAQRFEDALEPVDRVFDTVGGEVLDRSLRATRRDGLVVSIAGAPEPQAAMMEGMGRFAEALFWLASLGVRRRARRVGVGYRYLFMRPDGQQLAEIGRLIDEDKLRVLMDSVVPFDRALDALAHAETGRARGKIVLALRAHEA
ncbi:MAG TPA: NADP-dependent oxidoreductase [Haliangium sp.]|nr:NADP-dependent oxidoreductase [Haliangium sp.]